MWPAPRYRRPAGGGAGCGQPGTVRRPGGAAEGQSRPDHPPPASDPAADRRWRVHRTAAARDLGLSEETVKTHTRNALARLGARNRTDAVAIALRESLIE